MMNTHQVGYVQGEFIVAHKVPFPFLPTACQPFCPTPGALLLTTETLLDRSRQNFVITCMGKIRGRRTS